MTTEHDAADATTFRPSGLDLHHAGHRSALVFGPVDVPAFEVVADRLTALARLGPQTRIGLRPNPFSREWTFDPESLAAAVTVADPPTETDDPIALREVVRDAPGEQFRVVLAGDHIAIDYDHGLGDLPLLHFVGAALLGVTEPTSDATMRRYRHRLPPLVAAAARTASHPGRLTALARLSRKQSGAPDADLEAASAPLPTATPPQPPRALSSRIPPAETDALRAARDTHRPGVGLFALRTLALITALHEVGIAVSPTVTLPFDGRPFLPAHMDTLANFTAGLGFEVTSATAPEHLQAAITEAIRIGRPAANMLMTSLNARRVSRHGNSPSSATPTGGRPVAHLLHSNGGHVPGTGGWQWSDESRARVLGIAESPVPTGITVTSTFASDALCTTATFREDVFDAAAVRAALDLLGPHTRRLVGLR